MSSAAVRYVPRAPRYVLNIDDNTLMRFAGMETRGVSTRAMVRDLSETGLSFSLTNSEHVFVPDEGDMLKIEFHVPGRKQIACFATVVRIEEGTEWTPDYGHRTFKIIALQFRHLPSPYRRAIQLALREKGVREEATHWHSIENPQASRYGAFTLTLAGLAMMFYILAQPPITWFSSVKALFGA